MIISTSGYYSTGSSAAFVLLKEYGSCTDGILGSWEMKSHEYEHTVLYTPNGLFDLEDKLLVGNSIHRSDEALRSFLTEMNRLSNNKYIWCGDFGRLMGDAFLQAVGQFTEKLTDYRVPSHWAYHFGEEKFSFRKMLGSVRKKIMGKKIEGSFCKWPAYRTDEMIYYAFPSAEKFYSAARGLVSTYLRLMCGGDYPEKTLILNHFILPHNLFRLENYFGEDEIRVVVVERDPRDVFVMEKYRIRSDHSRIPCDDVREFVSFWKALRQSEKKADDKRVVRIRFEDMIYRYEDTVAFLEKECGLSPADHVHAGEYFSTEKSMYNTQLFKLDTKWDDEIAYIEQQLPEYLYPFPENSDFRETVSADQYGIYVC